MHYSFHIGYASIGSFKTLKNVTVKGDSFTFWFCFLKIKALYIKKNILAVLERDKSTVYRLLNCFELFTKVLEFS